MRFSPVSSVPYWDERCGVKFADGEDLEAAFDQFWRGVEAGSYAPRQMVLERFTLEKCARDYLAFADQYGAAGN